MVEEVVSKVESRSSFYSDGSYKFHKYADYFPLMNSQELEELGKSIRKDGQRDDIELLREEILDGRNRSLACQLEGITPRYKHYDSDLDPLDYVIIKNYYRRHLTPIQKAKIVVKLLKTERKIAKERRSRTQFNGRTCRNTPKLKPSVIPSEGHTEETQRKGAATRIVAKKLKMSHNSVAKIKRVNKMAKSNPFIKKYWEEAQKDNLSLEKAYRDTIRAIEIHRNKRHYAYRHLAEWERNHVMKGIDLEKTMKKEARLKFIQEGIKYLDSKKKVPAQNIGNSDEKDKRFCLDLDCPEIEKYMCRHCKKPNFLCTVVKTPVEKGPEDEVCYRYNKTFQK